MFESRPAISVVATPAAHATTHVTGGTDVVADAVDGGAAGLMTGAQVTKLAGIAAGADVTSTALLAVLTADADLLTRTGGALARLPKGTGSQVVRMTADATGHEHATLTASDVGAEATGTAATAAAAALAAAEAYADALVNGLDPKGSVYSAEGPSTDDTPGANVTRSGSQTVGGVVVPTGKRVALMAETDPADNGLWLTNDAGAWARTDDVLTTCAHFFVEYGTYAGREYLLTTTGTVVPGTTPQTWVPYRKMQLSAAAPQPLGVAAAGASGQASDGAHVHAMPSAGDVGADAAGSAAAAQSTASATALALVSARTVVLPVADYGIAALAADTELGGCALDPSELAVAGKTTVLTLTVEGRVSLAGVTMVVELYDEDAAAVAATVSVTATTLAPTTTHTASVALPGARHAYSLRARRTVGADPEYGVVRNAVVRVTYT